MDSNQWLEIWIKDCFLLFLFLLFDMNSVSILKLGDVFKDYFKAFPQVFTLWPATQKWKIIEKRTKNRLGTIFMTDI